MCSISWKFALIKQFNLWLDKGKGSCNGKRGEQCYHSVACVIASYKVLVICFIYMDFL